MKKITELIDIENRLIVAGDRGWWLGKMGEWGQKVQTSNYKIMYGMVIIVIILYCIFQSC